MTATLAIFNLVLGTAYVGYGVLTAMDLKRGWSKNGFSHFGAAWILMAFTCGPHHLAHALHLGMEGRPGGALDLLAVAVGLPAGVIWLMLRIEAYKGGRGDRTFTGTASWMLILPVLSVVYVGVFGFGAVTLVGRADSLSFTSTILPNLMLLSIYCAIGFLLWRTQIRNRRLSGSWSLSGVSLGIVFPTCALMHFAWVVYAISGVYHYDVHGFVIDWLAVPAALYFLWVVEALQRGSLADWNTEMDKRLSEETLVPSHA